MQRYRHGTGPAEVNIRAEFDTHMKINGPVAGKILKSNHGMLNEMDKQGHELLSRIEEINGCNFHTPSYWKHLHVDRSI
jgi:hypothetical protein